jgi:TolB-like protein/Flp pilus assembly protein TadD
MSFLREIKRRKIFQIAAVYAIVSWLLVQIVATVEEPLSLPAWFDTGVIVLLAIGFPITLIISWAFNLTPEGLVRDLGGTSRLQSSPKIEYALIGLLVLAVAFLFVDNYLLDDDPAGSSPRVSSTPDRDDAESAEPTPSAGQDSSSALATSLPARRVLENSVAVLPFENLSPDPDNAFFAAGIHEEVLNQLARLGNLSVISRTSMMRYADSELSVPEIARELNVETVMEGSVRYAGNRVRIAAQLIDAATDQHLWSEAYERDLADIFAIQADIAMNIANALEAEFSEAEQEAIEQEPTTSPAAYALYLQSRNLYGTPGSVAAAHALLDRAIAIDPEFASAFGRKAFLASASFVNSVQGAGVAPEGRNALEREVRDLAARALALDPDNADARQALRQLNVPTWRWSAFERALALGDEIGLSPAELWVHSWMGKHEEAIRLAERIVELDPNSGGPYVMLSVVLAYAGNRAASTRNLRQSIGLAPASTLARAWLAYNEIAVGNAENALAELRLLEQLLGDTRPIVFLPELAYSYSRIGRPDDARRLFDEIRSLGDESDFGAGTWAVAYLAIDDEDRALEQLELIAQKARNHEPDQGYLNVMNLKMNYLADPRVEQPAFADVLGRITGD